MNGCTAHSISADNVEALILTSVKRFSRFVLKDEETFALELQSLWKEKREEKPKQNQSELKRCQNAMMSFLPLFVACTKILWLDCCPNDSTSS